MSSTRVVCIRRKNGQIIQDCDIYIGRTWKLGGWSLEASKWANPFTLKNSGSVEKSLQLYEEHVRSKPELLGSLEELRGKVLGCWCKKKGDEPCHGDILVRLLEEEIKEENVVLFYIHTNEGTYSQTSIFDIKKLPKIKDREIRISGGCCEEDSYQCFLCRNKEIRVEYVKHSPINPELRDYITEDVCVSKERILQEVE